MNFSTLVLSDHFVGPSQEEYFHADFDDYQNTIDLHYYHSNYYPVYSEGLASLRKGNSSYRHTDPRNGTAQTQGGLIIEDSLNLSVMALEEARQYEWRRSDQAMSSPSSTMTSLAYPLASTSVTASASHVNIDENSVGVRGKAQAQHQHLQQYLQQQQHCQQGSNIPLLLSSSLSSPLYQPSHPLAPPQVTFNAGTESTSPPSVPTILGEQAVAGSSPAPASSPTVAMDYMLSTANQGYMFVPPPSSHSHFQPDHSSYEAHQQQHHHEHEQEQLSVSLHGNRSVPLYLPVSVPTGFQGYNQQAEASVAWANASVSNTFASPDMVQGHHHQYYQQHHQQQKQPRMKNSKTKHLRGQLHVMTTSDSDIGFIYPSASGSVQQTKDPISTTSPPNATTAVNVPGFPGYTICGHTSSPVDSTFSGSSTPSFASLSPSLSHSSNSETSVSCESSRATSPSALTHESNSGASHHHTDRKKRLSVSESSIIRARKLSTSSTSSTGSTSKRRMSTLRESTAKDTLSSPTATTPTTTTLSHQCPQCRLCFAGPAVLVRHIESIHDKLLWNCMGCKSNLSRRDAVTRHINLSPMDSICRAVGTIGQIKMLDGSEVHYEISTYRAKPLEEVMGRMGARRGSVSGPSMAGSVPAKEFDRVKMEPQEEEDIDADGMEEIEYGFVSCRTQEEEEEGSGCVGRDERKKRRRSSVASIGRKKKY